MYIRNINGVFYVNNKDKAEEYQVIYNAPYYYPVVETEEYGIRYFNNEFQILDEELAKAYHESNIEFIVEDSFENIVKSYQENPLPEDGTIVSENGDVLLLEDPTTDNFLTIAVKRALNSKRVPLSYFNNKVGKAHDINNMAKSINQGNVTNKRFESLADILDVEYCLILQDKQDTKLPMGEQVVVFTPGFSFEDKKLFSNDAKDLVDKFRKKIK
ncbi:hypothetical protein DLH72_04555 [Candidatus Gracilibacteria bacterium]|nr:MAG: hypothetical protein DLH72_04555 [Candidatus Gracilibacteria bacterium]